MFRTCRIALIVAASSVAMVSCVIPPPVTPPASTTTTSPVPVPFPAGCLEDASGGGPDLAYNGVVNAAGNMNFWDSRDGSCSGVKWGWSFTLVRAADQTAATALCASLGLASRPAMRPIPGTEYPLPADAWYCDDYVT